MLYLFLLKFALLVMLCALLLKRNNLSVKLWTDDQLIKSLPRYQQMRSQASARLDFKHFLDLDTRIDLIKSETKCRFNYKRVKTKVLDYENKKVLIKNLEDKRKQAFIEGNRYAQSLLDKEIEQIVSH